MHAHRQASRRTRSHRPHIQTRRHEPEEQASCTAVLMWKREQPGPTRRTPRTPRARAVLAMSLSTSSPCGACACTCTDYKLNSAPRAEENQGLQLSGQTRPRAAAAVTQRGTPASVMATRLEPAAGTRLLQGACVGMDKTQPQLTGG